MPLQCLAVIGKANEPLYLMDVTNSDDEKLDQPDDAFGFAEANRDHHLSLQKEVSGDLLICEICEI